MRVTVHDRIADIPADEWNALDGAASPPLRHEFLHAAEQSGSVSPEAGWLPSHLAARDDDGILLGAMPLYEKHHSWGEFVFDWAWAHAYERAGLDYYPKLVSAIPFTPTPGNRLLLSKPGDNSTRSHLVRAALALARERDCSSLHILFPLEHELEHFTSEGLMLRKDCQFHWHNDGYRTFDEFLATFSSAKRKKARRDRRHVAEAGIRFRRVRGSEISAELWQSVYSLISRTFMRRGSLPYFDLGFFESLSQNLQDDVLVILAEDNSGPVAASVFYIGDDVLYGRYWGSIGHHNALHFETCYYQGIEFCIDEEIAVFNPGTQGEHKISRGFLPVETWSMHWLERPEFFAAISEYVDEESQHIDRYMQAVNEHSPFRNNGSGE